MDREYLKKEDYAEPDCPFCTDAYEDRPVHTIPIGRVIDKLDEYLTGSDTAAAERHLKYWFGEASDYADRRGMFTLCNEFMGLYRSLGNRDGALKYAEEAISLIGDIGIEDTVSAGTAYVNAATCMKAFGDPARSIELFVKARDIYEKLLPRGDEKFGGLYNNMALTLVDLKRYGEAREMFGRALEVMAERNAVGEQAITYVNLACLADAELGENGDGEIRGYLDRARELLLQSDAQGRDYESACGKCASAFTYFGDAKTGEELQRRANGKYERT